jgi:dipeptidyl aminopeptidase/acylaminoacyl peptidase
MNEYTNDLQVTPQTPQAIIFCSADDHTVVPDHGIRYFKALITNGVPASLHIYPTGGHGWGYNENFIYKRQWTGELEKWLGEINK